jgi:hypothetical protein
VCTCTGTAEILCTCTGTAEVLCTWTGTTEILCTCTGIAEILCTCTGTAEIICTCTPEPPSSYLSCITKYTDLWSLLCLLLGVFTAVYCIWNMLAHAQKPDFIFRRNGRVHLNWRGRQFSRLLAAEVCASEVVMLDTPCSEIVWRVPATHSVSQFPLHFPSHASPYAITFQLDSTLMLGSFTSSEFLFSHHSWPPFLIMFPSRWCYKNFWKVNTHKLHWSSVAVYELSDRARTTKS